MTIQTAINLIHQMDDADLVEVARAVKQRRRFLAGITARSLRVGDEVEFTGRKSGYVRGQVVKINHKTVDVRAHGRAVQWRVPAEMLRAV